MDHFRHPSDASRRFYRDLLGWGGKRQQVRVSEPGATARLHTGAEATYLRVVNPRCQPVRVDLELSPQRGPFGRGQAVWGESQPDVAGQQVALRIGGRAAAVVKLVPT